MRLHAANLSPKVTEARLIELFQQFGKVIKVDLNHKSEFSCLSGAAIVEMNCAEGLNAVRALNGRAFRGRRMYIRVFR